MARRTRRRERGEGRAKRGDEREWVEKKFSNVDMAKWELRHNEFTTNDLPQMPTGDLSLWPTSDKDYTARSTKYRQQKDRCN